MSSGNETQTYDVEGQMQAALNETIPNLAVTPIVSPPSPPQDGSPSPPPPPPATASSPTEPPPSPPSTPPSSPPPSTPPPLPSISPPPSTPSNESPPSPPPTVVPSKPSSSPPAPQEQDSQPGSEPSQDNGTTPFSPSPPLSPDSRSTVPSPSLGTSSPPLLPSPPAPNLPNSPFQAPTLPTSPAGSTPLPPSSSLPSPSGSGSKSPAGNSNHTPQNHAVNGSVINNKINFNQQKTMITMVGIGVAGAVMIAFLGVLFFVRRKNKRAYRQANEQFLPPPNFTVQTDGNYYGQKASVGNSGQTDRHQNSQQNSSTGNSSGSQKPGGTPDSAVIGSSKTLFTYEELTQITSAFSRESIIGEGGFGCVYKGFLSNGKVVAVKQLKAGSGQGDREFKAEVEIISRVHHRHLVSLVGYCIYERHRLLIYEFVPNNTLEHHLHGKDVPVLDWAKRVKIAVGAAKGLAYLHEDCYPKIIHRDIKSANILLDNDFEAQVADFGLARLYDTTHTHVSTRVMGTFGYLAPEYASSGKLTDKSDVFSFGVVLLELITGRKPVDPSQPLGEESLVEWARPFLIQTIETRDISELVDPRLKNLYVESEVFKMIETAASCVRHSAQKRPRMVQVVRALDSEKEMSDLSNGVKVGQSIAYNSGQYNQDIEKFRKLTLVSDELLYSGTYGGDYTRNHEYMSN